MDGYKPMDHGREQHKNLRMSINGSQWNLKKGLKLREKSVKRKKEELEFCHVSSLTSSKEV